MNPVFLKRFLIVLYAAGLIGMHLPATAALFTSLVPLTLWFTAFICLVFALTVVKVTRGEPMQGFDHVVRPELMKATDQ